MSIFGLLQRDVNSPSSTGHQKLWATLMVEFEYQRKGARDHFAMISGVTTILVFRMHSIFRIVTFVISAVFVAMPQRQHPS